MHPLPSGAKARPGLATTALVNKVLTQLRDQSPQIELGTPDHEGNHYFRQVAVKITGSVTGSGKKGFYFGLTAASDIQIDPTQQNIEDALGVWFNGSEKVLVGNLTEIDPTQPKLDDGDVVQGLVVGNWKGNETPFVLVVGSTGPSIRNGQIKPDGTAFQMTYVYHEFPDDYIDADWFDVFSLADCPDDLTVSPRDFTSF